jgi:hypothetical protein
MSLDYLGGWRRRFTPALLPLVLVSACAMTYDGKYDFDKGWRFGGIVKVGPGTSLPPIASGDCREGVPADEVARTSYAEIRYQNEGRWIRHRIVPIPAGMAITQGTNVYFDVNDCGKALVKAS